MAAVNRIKPLPDNRARTESQNYLNLVQRTAIYREGAYVNVIYYQIYDDASITDAVLDNAFDVITSTTGIKYKKISPVPMFGVDAAQITTQFTDSGLVSIINQEGEFIPDTVVPVAGDFFEFDLPDFKGHLFQVTGTQFSYTGAKKFYKVEYSLYDKDTDAIFGNVVEENVLEIDHIGTELQTVIKKTTDITAGEAEAMVDALIDRYVEDYYDDSMNAFVYRADDSHYLWSQYLQHFLSKNKVINRYRKKILEGIYLLDINKFDNGSIYDEKKYRNSIFNAVEKKANTVTADMTYAFESTTSLRMRCLPFFSSTEIYKLLDMGENLTAFPFTIKDYNSGMYWSADAGHKFTSTEELQNDLSAVDNETKYSESLKAGDVLYQSYEDTTVYHPVAKDIYYVDTDGTLEPAALTDMLDSKEGYSEFPLFILVRKYIQGELTLTDDLLSELNSYYYDINAENYIYIPLVIYILQKLIHEMLKK